jgi:hypothetical protein
MSEINLQRPLARLTRRVQKAIDQIDEQGGAAQTRTSKFAKPFVGKWEFIDRGCVQRAYQL